MVASSCPRGRSGLVGLPRQRLVARAGLADRQLPARRRWRSTRSRAAPACAGSRCRSWPAGPRRRSSPRSRPRRPGRRSSDRCISTWSARSAALMSLTSWWVPVTDAGHAVGVAVHHAAAADPRPALRPRHADVELEVVALRDGVADHGGGVLAVVRVHPGEELRQRRPGLLAGPDPVVDRDGHADDPGGDVEPPRPELGDGAGLLEVGAAAVQRVPRAAELGEVGDPDDEARDRAVVVEQQGVVDQDPEPPPVAVVEERLLRVPALVSALPGALERPRRTARGRARRGCRRRWPARARPGRR